MIWAPLLRYSQKFAARAAYYRRLALSDTEQWRAETLFSISALFLEMANHMAEREKTTLDSPVERRGEIIRKFLSSDLLRPSRLTQLRRQLTYTTPENLNADAQQNECK